MNESVVNYCIDVDGNVVTRSLSERIRVVLFAGSKRLFDTFVSFVGLIILAPLMLLIGLIIKLDSKGPILFKQERTGKHGKIFNLYKFRTMVADNDVRDFSKKDEQTRFGAFLRKTSLDELPQLINIFNGQMSFIGPRPWIHDYFEKMNGDQRRRYALRPGLTGLAQVMGRNRISIFKKIEYDIEYINNYSFSQDIRIIFLTIKTVFAGRGYDAGKDTIQKELDALAKKNNK